MDCEQTTPSASLQWTCLPIRRRSLGILRRVRSPTLQSCHSCHTAWLQILQSSDRLVTSSDMTMPSSDMMMTSSIMSMTSSIMSMTSSGSIVSFSLFYVVWSASRRNKREVYQFLLLSQNCCYILDFVRLFVTDDTCIKITDSVTDDVMDNVTDDVTVNVTDNVTDALIILSGV